MKLVTVAGIQGSGKTTLIRELILRLWAQGNKSAVIVNEEGEEAYTPEFLETHEVKIFRLQGG
jgi:G3E family GTPase